MLKATFDQAGVDIKEALNALIAELETSTSASNIGANIGSVTTKTVQAILTSFEGAIANRYTKLELDTLLSEGTNNLVADIDVNLTTGVITVTKKDGTVIPFDTAIEKVPSKLEFVESGDTYILKITNVDGTTTQADVTKLMNIYNFNNSDYITFEVTGEGTKKTVTATIKANSIGIDKLSLSAVSTLEGYVSSARDSANAAKTSETNAKTSEINAKASEVNAADSANTAVTKAQEASTSASNAKTSETNAKTSETNAEYWAKQAQASSQGGDMQRSTYDTDGDGVVDNSQKLGGQAPSYYAKAEDLTSNMVAVASQISTLNTTMNEKAITKKFTATIPTTGWSSSAPYTNTITVSGMLASDSNFPVSPAYSTTATTRKLQAEAWGKVTMIAAGANSITVTCDEEIPTTAIPIQITVVR